MPGVITCSLLAGQRFGNALFMYAFARAYAESLGCELQTPPWIGQKIFENVKEPPISVSLPSTELDTEMYRPIGYFFGERDIDLRVYAQHQRYLDFYTRRQAREWFTFKSEFDAQTPIACAVAHLRLGDYLLPPACHSYCQVPIASYRRAADKFRLPVPLMLVHEGWNDDIHALPKDFDWLPDFLVLRNAHFLLRANSSFSWWASTLGGGTTYSPVVGDKAGLNHVEFVEGNWPCTAGRFRNQSDLYLKEA